MKLTPTQKALQHEYAQLREKSEKRRKRLESAGFKGYAAPKVRDIESPAQLKLELAKLQRAMEKPTATVTGARAAKAARKNRQLTEKEEARRQRHNDANRRYYERQKERRQEWERAIKEFITEEKSKDKRVGQALANLYSGLKHWGVVIKDPAELAAWGQYIKERKQDSEKQFYEFDRWVQDMAAADAKTIGRVRGSDVMALLVDFEEWKSKQENLKEEFNRERSVNEYSGSAFISLWNAFLKKRKGK